MNEIVFAEENRALLQNLADVAKTKKACEQKEKELKEELLPLMEKHGVTSIDNDFIRISYVPKGEDSIDIDKAKLKMNDPDLYNSMVADYPKKVAGKKAHLRFTPK